MGNTNSQKEVQNTTEGSSVDPLPQPKPVSNGDVSRDKRTVENDTNDEDIRKDAVESYIDETDGRDGNDDFTSLSNQASTSPTLDDLLDEDKRENVHDVLNDKKEGGQESEILLNSKNIQDDFENSASEKSQDSYNVEETCPIVDDLDLISEESDNASSEDIEELEIDDKDQQKEIKAEIQMQVKRFFESIEKVENDHQEILSLINKRSMSQKELNEDGLNIIAELESIVEKFTQRRKEKDEAIQHLKAILSTLTGKLSVIEQEIQNLQSREEVVDLTRKCNGNGQSDETTTVRNGQLDEATTVRNGQSDEATTVRNDQSDEATTLRNGQSDEATTVRNDQSDEATTVRNGQSDEATTVRNNITTPWPVQTAEKNVSQESPQVETRKDGTVVIVKEQINKDVDRKDTSSHQSSTGRTMKENAMEDRRTPHFDGTHNAESSDKSYENIPSTDSNTRPSLPVQSQELEQERHTNNGASEINNRSNPDNNKNRADMSNFLETQNVFASKSKKTLPQTYWVDKANDILMKRIINTGQSDMICGPNTVLCLDTSGSMWGNAFQTMINLSLKFLSGVKDNSGIAEKVGLVCFGADTRVISHCCLDFPPLKREIKKLSPGGPSPLTAGLMLALALVKGGVTIPHVNGTGFLPRIIVFTDGVVTPELVTDCEDYVPQGRDALEILSSISMVANHFQRNGNRVYFVPLGQANQAMISPLAEATCGKIIQPANFDKLIYQYKVEFLAANLREHFPNYQEADLHMVRMASESSGASLRGIDMDDLVEYVRNPPPMIRQDEDDDDDDDDNDGKGAYEGSSNMPPIGTRVRRGPDWESKFNGQDGNGPGTVTSHGQGGHIWVMWDNGHRNVYPYGSGNRFAVMVVDEPRLLQQDQLIEVGCLVRRGDNWRDNDEDGGAGNIGVVFRVHSDATVGVRWPNGHKRRYKYGKQGFFEVEICDPFDEDVRLRMLSMSFRYQDSTDDRSNNRPRVEDFINTDEKRNNRRTTLEEMNKRNNMCSNRIEDQLETDSNPISESTREKTVEVNDKNQSFGNSRDASEVEPKSDLVERTKDSIISGVPVTERESDSEEKQVEFVSALANDSIKESEQDKNNVSTITIRNQSLIVNEPNCVGKADENEETIVPIKLPEKSEFSRTSSSEMSSNLDNGCNVIPLDQASGMSSSTDDITIRDDVNVHSDKDTAKDENETVIWQVYDRYEGWRDFPPEVNRRFQVQLSKMIHIHPVTKEMSGVRRKVTGV
ncbi:uncharacterized protein LOC125649965 isoform X2 [Ostrea edulis]|uniref:uncharacterized protein LOC125649965 isoform X2 n=1 Tax=Ostrea edulis TaxID=37623 RepID=UPI0024AFF1E5|nr:uncharacterized protein LOC125649965 isoform X2 [Ostrea edulis]